MFGKENFNQGQGKSVIFQEQNDQHYQLSTNNIEQEKKISKYVT